MVLLPPTASRHCQALLLVFSRLSTAELCVASQVCRQWRAVSHHPLLWQRIGLRERVLSCKVGLRVCLYHTNRCLLTSHTGPPNTVSVVQEDKEHYTPWSTLPPSFSSSLCPSLPPSLSLSLTHDYVHAPPGLMPEMAEQDEELHSYIARQKYATPHTDIHTCTLPWAVFSTAQPYIFAPVPLSQIG